MADSREVDIKLIVDDKGAITSINGFDQKIKTTVSDVEKLNQGLGQSNSQLGTFKIAIGSALGNLAGNAISLATSKLLEYTNIFQQLRDIAPIEAQRASFEVLSKQIGEDATSALAKYREATKGYVSDSDLVAVANQAMLLGVNTNAEAFARLTADAVKLGDAMGISVKDSVESLTLGIGRQSKLILDNLGVIVNTEQAYKNFADANGLLASKLTDSQQKLAFQEEAFRQIAEKAKTLPPVLNTSADAVQLFDARLKNLGDEVLLSLSKNESLRDSIQEVADKLLEVDTKRLADGLGILAGYIADAIQLFTNLGVAVSDAVINFDTFYAKIGDGGKTVQGFGTVINNTTKQIADGLASLDELKSEKSQKQVDNLIVKFNELKKTADTNSLLKIDETTSNKLTILQTKITEILKGAGNNKGLELLASGVTKLGNEAEKTTPKINKVDTGIKSTGESSKKSDGDLKRLEQTIKNIAGTEGSISDLSDSFKDVFDPKYEKTAEELEKSLKVIADELIRSGIPAQDVAKAIKDADDNAKDLKKTLEDSRKRLEEMKPINIGSLFATDTTGYGQGDKARDKQIEEAINRAKDIAGAFEGAFADAISTVLSGSSLRDQMDDIGGQLGQALGASIGGPIGGAIGDYIGQKLGKDLSQIGTSTNASLKGAGTAIATALMGPIGLAFGDQFGKVLTKAFGKNDPSANARKAFQGWFNDLIEKSDIDFSGILKNGFQLPNGRNAFDSIINDAGEATTAVNEELKKLNISPETLGTFQGLGTALGVISGTSLEGLLGQFGQLLAVNFQNAEGLNELQLLLQSTGMSSEQMGQALESAFLKGTISASEYLQGLSAVNEVMTKGVPSAIGAINIAFNNLVSKGLKDGLHGMDALGDLAVEAGELGIKSLDGLKNALIAQGLPAQQVNVLFSQLGASGIKTLEQLKNITAQSTASVIAGLDSQKTFFAEQSKNIDELANKLNQIQNKEVEVKVNFKASYSDESTKQAVTNTYGDYGSNGVGAGG